MAIVQICLTARHVRGSVEIMENLYANEWDATQDREGYRWSRARLARRLGGERLGGSVYLLGPGQKSFPYHFHHANEEMLIVLEGEVTVRTPDGHQHAGRGDALIFNRGESGAHQVVNDTDTEARILMMSTMIDPEIVEYPDSGNVGIFASRAPGAPGGLRKILDGAAESDYFKDGQGPARDT
jgi:uncharacterized cupin superfamily protein